MHLRHGFITAIALPISAVVFWGFPAAAEASVGVGVQAGPVRLAGAAHPGGSYQLPPVYVVDTGTEPESVRVRVQRLSPGPGRAVPPSWVHATGPGLQLAAHQGARIPLELVVPAGARPGRYLSDVVVAASAAVSAGRANLGVGAATKLEFTVRPGSAPGLWPAIPAWPWWTLIGLLLAAVAVAGARRSGLRIRVERGPPAPTLTPAAGGPASPGRGRAAWPGRWWLAAALIVVITLLGLTACGALPPPAPAAGQGRSVAISLRVVPSVRSVSVSPGTAKFGACKFGRSTLDTASTSGALGFPNGQCWVGSRASGLTRGVFPITVANTGIAADIDVSGTSAVPSDNGTQWTLCNLGASPAVSCAGAGGKVPGVDQYVLQNFGASGRLNFAGLTGTPVCDTLFGTRGGCWTTQGAAQSEGFKIIGPERSDDLSTSWTISITWTPVPA